MCVGVATANSILVVSFAKEKLAEHGDTVKAAIEAAIRGSVAFAMIIGMVPDGARTRRWRPRERPRWDVPL